MSARESRVKKNLTGEKLPDINLEKCDAPL